MRRSSDGVSSCVLLLFSYDLINTVTLLWSYMAIYNLALYLIFFTLLQFVMIETKTLYSFSALGATTFFNKALTISLFSMAGVPPFLGFFAKLFLFVLLCGSNFLTLFPSFFLILFISLYFYIQNIRFLNSTGPSNFQPSYEFNVRNVPLYYVITLTGLFLLTFGFMYTEDLLAFTRWLLA